MKQATFFLILGIALTVAALLMCIRFFFQKTYTIREQPRGLYGIIGGAIGFLSGMTGIGGGIYLAPILRLGQYDTAKNIAGLSSFFILVNSISGLFGQAAKGAIIVQWSFTLPLIVAVIAGGQIGSRVSAGVLKPRWVEAATAVLILYAGTRMLFNHQ